MPGSGPKSLKKQTNNMKTRNLILLAALCLAAACAPKKPTSVLVLYENHGWHKAFTDTTLAWLGEKAETYNLALTPITRVTPVDKEYLKQFDVILQLDYAPYNWPDAAFEAFEDYIREFCLAFYNAGAKIDYGTHQATFDELYSPNGGWDEVNLTAYVVGHTDYQVCISASYRPYSSPKHWLIEVEVMKVDD